MLAAAGTARKTSHRTIGFSPRKGGVRFQRDSS
jgi:hypothetical protein